MYFLFFAYFIIADCTSLAFQCYDQRCIPRSRVCDGYIDCFGKFQEDEEGCTAGSLESCSEWLVRSKKTDGLYPIHLGTDGKMFAVMLCFYMFFVVVVFFVVCVCVCVFVCVCVCVLFLLLVLLKYKLSICIVN